jgi:hypothetical protein
MTPARSFGIVLAFGAIGLIAGDGAATTATSFGAGSGSTMFVEAKWPFGLDQWGRGRAFDCKSSRCGADAKLYVRAKVGFCDCFDHVDEDDVDRLTDFDFIRATAVSLGADRPMWLGGDPARLRAFRLDGPRGSAGQALSVVVARDCQALVALMVLDRDTSPALESAVLDLVTTASPADSALAWNN